MPTLQLKHGTFNYPVPLEDDAKLSEAMQTIEKLTNVPVSQQKLICQGKILNPRCTVKASKLKDGSKVMLMTSGGQTQVLASIVAALVCFPTVKELHFSN